MKIWTTTELQTLSRAQLQALLDETLALLASLAPCSVEYAEALATVANIRAVLAQHRPVRRRPVKAPAP